MMTDVEELLRVTFAERGDRVTAPSELGARVRRKARARRRKITFGVATACALTLTAGVIAARLSAPGPDTLSTATSAGPQVPPGSQPVSFHGVQVLVPDSWKFDDTRCGTPIANTALIEDGSGIPLCLFPEPPGLTVATLSVLSSPHGQQLAALATKATTVDGHAGKRGTGLEAGHRVTVVTVPSIDVVVSVYGPLSAVTDSIISSARVVPVDSNGCQDRVDPLVPGGASAQAGANERLVPGTPGAAVLCRYTGNWLARSQPLPSSQLTDLVNILDGLPGAAAPGPVPADCEEEHARGFVVHFTYPHHPPVLVTVHLAGCQQVAGNGSRWARMNSLELVTLLTRAAGYDGPLADPSTYH